MKIVLIVLITCVSIFGEYQQGKIDMHGGKNYNGFGSQRSSFTNMKMSALLDSNSSKKTKEREERKR